MIDFAYTGSAQSFTLKPGKYKLEVWGAQGGYSYGGKAIGGKGGYSNGEISLSASMTIYAYVGGKGADCVDPPTGTTPGGWNGGGSSTGYAGWPNSGSRRRRWCV